MNELRKRIKSFGYAFKGIASLLKREHNAWIHCIAIIVVTLAGLHFGITRTEFALYVYVLVWFWLRKASIRQ